jgi:hypothetical protein
MATFIGNSNDLMNWADLVSLLESIPPRNRGSTQDDDIHIENPKVEALIKIWEKAGYVDSPSVQWVDFLPVDHFPQQWVNKFATYVNAVPAGCWVSAVPPGFLVPWHPDYKSPSQEQELLKKGVPNHYTVYICEPSFGQVSIIDNHAIYNATQGDVYKWDHWQDWHGGMNMGTKTKYMFNFFGWPNE